MTDKVWDVIEFLWDAFLGLSPVILPIIGIILFGIFENKFL